jgi:hypothetical protein
MTAMRQAEALGGWIEVVELKGSDGSVVATDATPATRFGDQDSLHLPPALSHCVLPASPATPRTLAIHHELGKSVVTAKPRSPRVSGAEPLRRITRPNLDWLRQPELIDPVADRLDAHLKSACNLSERKTLPDQRLKFPSPDALSRPELVGTVGDKAVTLCPVTHGSRGATDQPADLGERHSLIETLLQKRLVDAPSHDPILTAGSVGKTNVCSRL